MHHVSFSFFLRLLCGCRRRYAAYKAIHDGDAASLKVLQAAEQLWWDDKKTVLEAAAAAEAEAAAAASAKYAASIHIQSQCSLHAPALHVSCATSNLCIEQPLYMVCKQLCTACSCLQ